MMMSETQFKDAFVISFLTGDCIGALEFGGKSLEYAVERAHQLADKAWKVINERDHRLYLEKKR